MRYRADIDGLRAVAVLPVVLFHADFQIVSGGYVGVDIFFVISGYLITKVLLDENRSRSFSLLNFYNRRMRRIFPALFSVIFTSVLVGAWLLAPSDFKQFGQSAAAASLFSSNIFFWWKTNYFDTALDAKPLLHTWSLGVEEQFYVVFPLLLFFLYRFYGERSKYYILILVFISFALSIYGVDKHPSAAFYLAPTRTWELLLGSLLAFGLFPDVRSRPLREIYSLIAAALILFCVLTYSRETPFPGLRALPACLGAALIIHSGASGASYLRSVLSTRPMVFIGLISYSLYLWHWPLITLYKQYAIESMGQTDRIAVVLLSIAIAAASWKFIEQPFRGSRSTVSSRVLYAGSALAAFSGIGIGVFAHVTDGWPERFSGSARALSDYSKSYDPRRAECMSGDWRWIDPDKGCVYGANVAPTVALWGDSHAATLAPSIGTVAERYGASIKLLSYAGCPSALGLKRIGKPLIKCIEYNAATIDFLEKEQSLRTVVLASRHALYLRGWSLEVGPAEMANGAVDGPGFVTTADKSALETADRDKIYLSSLKETVRRLVASGKNVVLVYPVPEVGYDVPKTLFKLSVRGVAPDSFIRPADLFRKRNKIVFEVLDRLGYSENIVRIYPDKPLCDEAHCFVTADGKVLYQDDNHLSLEGAAYVSGIFQPLFNPIERHSLGALDVKVK